MHTLTSLQPQSWELRMELLLLFVHLNMLNSGVHETVCVGIWVQMCVLGGVFEYWGHYQIPSNSYNQHGLCLFTVTAERWIGISSDRNVTSSRQAEHGSWARNSSSLAEVVATELMSVFNDALAEVQQLYCSDKNPLESHCSVQHYVIFIAIITVWDIGTVWISTLLYPQLPHTVFSSQFFKSIFLYSIFSYCYVFVYCNPMWKCFVSSWENDFVKLQSCSVQSLTFFFFQKEIKWWLLFIWATKTVKGINHGHKLTAFKDYKKILKMLKQLTNTHLLTKCLKYEHNTSHKKLRLQISSAKCCKDAASALHHNILTMEHQSALKQQEPIINPAPHSHSQIVPFRPKEERTSLIHVYSPGTWLGISYRRHTVYSYYNSGQKNLRCKEVGGKMRSSVYGKLS